MNTTVVSYADALTVFTNASSFCSIEIGIVIIPTFCFSHFPSKWKRSRAMCHNHTGKKVCLEEAFMKSKSLMRNWEFTPLMTGRTFFRLASGFIGSALPSLLVLMYSQHCDHKTCSHFNMSPGPAPWCSDGGQKEQVAIGVGWMSFLHQHS